MDDDAIVRSELLGSLFPAQVVAFEARALVQDAGSLLQEEAAHVARASPKRLREFATGRACARRALAELGLTGVALAAAPDRSPRWPESVVGSLTHTDGYCAVVVGRKERISGIGVDAEGRGKVDSSLWDLIFTPIEIARLTALPPQRQPDTATILFSAKETFFKCQYPLTQEWIDFRDVAIDIDIDSCGFSVHPLRDLRIESRCTAPLTGRFAICEDLVITGMFMPHECIGQT